MLCKCSFCKNYKEGKDVICSRCDVSRYDCFELYIPKITKKTKKKG